MEYNLPVVAKKLVKIAESLGENISLLPETEIAQKAVDNVKEILSAVGIKENLSEWKIKKIIFCI